MNDQNRKIDPLRQRAEEWLNRNAGGLDGQPLGEIRSLIGELHDRQLALERQNERLRQEQAAFESSREHLATTLRSIGDAVIATGEYHMQEALRESEDKYRSLAENSHDYIMRYDRRHRHVFANAAALSVSGKRADEFIGKTYREMGFPDHLCDLWEIAIERVFITGEPHQEVFQWTGAQGPVVLDWRLFPERGVRGDVTSVLGVSRDITEQKRVEAAVRLNESRLQCLVNIAQHEAGSIQELLDYALGEALGLTGSRIGYIYHYDEKKRRFTLNTWSREVMAQCDVVDRQTVYQLEKTGIWGEAVRQRKPIVINDFEAANPLKKGYPAGHVALNRFMTVPLFSHERIVAVAGVANKESDYDQIEAMVGGGGHGRGKAGAIAAGSTGAGKRALPPVVRRAGPAGKGVRGPLAVMPPAASRPQIPMEEGLQEF